jgi:hypothetical protein
VVIQVVILTLPGVRQCWRSWSKDNESEPLVAGGELSAVCSASPGPLAKQKGSDMCWAESSKMCNECANALALRISLLAAQNPLRLSKCTLKVNSQPRSDWAAKDCFRRVFFDFQCSPAKAGRNRHRIPGWCPGPDSNRHGIASEGF